MWQQALKWRATILVLVAPIAVWILRGNLDVPGWMQIVAIIVVGLLGVSYVVFEVVWNLRGTMRPCAHCGHETPMRTFSVHHTCPKCGGTL